MSKWNYSLPVYVTNPRGDGFIADYSLNVWMAMLIYILILINALGWGIYGVIELLQKVI